jgi:hypothetical protein
MKKNKFYISSEIDHKVLNKLGFFVLQKAFKIKTMDEYKEKLLINFASNKIKKTKNHLVEVKIDRLNFFKKIYKDPQLKKIVKNFYNGNVGSDFFRVVKKDKDNTSAVFCHQDTGYQFGSFNRYSLFISLTNNNSLNGGLIVYPMTHKFGYLGDVGEISKKVTNKFVKYCPSLESGDVLIMHSSLWHESKKNFKKKERIYLEIHIQDSAEPFTKFTIIGKKKSSIGIEFNKNKIFSNSRTQRIIRLKNKLKKIEKKLELVSNNVQ